MRKESPRVSKDSKWKASWHFLVVIASKTCNEDMLISTNSNKNEYASNYRDRDSINMQLIRPHRKKRETKRLRHAVYTRRTTYLDGWNDFILRAMIQMNLFQVDSY